jgi:hypothetical protein
MVGSAIARVHAMPDASSRRRSVPFMIDLLGEENELERDAKSQALFRKWSGFGRQTIQVSSPSPRKRAVHADPGC